MNTVQRAYRYRFYPTAEQEAILSQTFGCARFVYNHFLRVRTDGFYPVSYTHLDVYKRQELYTGYNYSRQQ